MDKYWELMTSSEDPSLKILRELIDLYDDLHILRYHAKT